MPYNSLVTRSNTSALVPEEVSTAMLTSLSAQSAVLEMGNVIPISRNQERFPVLSALPTAYFVSGDTGLKQTTQAAWDNKYMYVEEIATIIPIPDAVIDDSGFDVWGYLQPLMEAAIARTLDAAVIFGTNAPTTWATEGNLVGKADAAGNVVARGTNNAAAGGIYGDLSDLVGKLEADGYQPDGAVGNITLKGRLRQTRATDGQTIPFPADIPEPMYALPGLWPAGTNAAELLVGDWTKLVVGVRQDMTYKLITEGVITDNTGAIVYNLPQQDMSALRLVFRAAYAVSNPINYQEGVAANRSPFAVLRSPAT
ncbi:phage major capsid protein [Nocardioides kribbensis]|uniref:Phage major capsid protein n=1 Tax=Nocardioides kribbensis TaxID=305517 RepID=A0ABV1NZ22_9ACTN